VPAEGEVAAGDEPSGEPAADEARAEGEVAAGDEPSGEPAADEAPAEKKEE
jgi:hypothetical protein